MSTPISSITLGLGGMGMGSWWEDMVCVWLLVWTLVCWVVYWLAVRFDLNSPRGPAHAIGTEFYPVLRLIVLPSILGRILVNFPIFKIKIVNLIYFKFLVLVPVPGCQVLACTGLRTKYEIPWYFSLTLWILARVQDWSKFNLRSMQVAIWIDLALCITRYQAHVQLCTIWLTTVPW